MIREAILKSKACTIAHLSGTVASAATVIGLSCDDLLVSPFLSFMAHNYFHGVQGTGNQVKDYVDFTDRELKRAFRLIYTNFLTEEEIQLVTERDKEVWLNEVEVAERWVSYRTASKLLLGASNEDIS
jgi:ATP-dependent protease ClpP protease subunit